MTTWTDSSPSGAAEPARDRGSAPGRGVPHQPAPAQAPVPAPAPAHRAAPAQEPPSADLRAAVADFNWLLHTFASETAGVVDAIGVSADGLLIAVSELREHGESERLAAIVSGLTSLAMGASGNYGLGGLNKVIVDLEGGHLLVSAIGVGAVLGVVTSKEAKLGNIAYEMTLFANRAGTALSPELIMELKRAVGTVTGG